MPGSPLPRSTLLALAVTLAACGDDGNGNDSSTDGGTDTDTAGTGTSATDSGGSSGSSSGSGGTDTDTSSGSSGSGGSGTTGGGIPELDRHEPVFLPGGRENVPYASMLPGASGYTILEGSVPAGLNLDEATGTVTGTPTAPGIYEWVVTGEVDGELVGFCVQLPVYSTDDSGTTTTDDPSLPGPHDVGRVLVSVDSITVSTGTWPDVNVLVTYPATEPDGDVLPAGTFPLIAFHHAAHSPPDIFDDYGALHEHWASHGYVVASVDSTMNLTPTNMGWQSQSWSNLHDMSTFQRAAIARLHDANDDAGSRFFGKIDTRRTVVSGHSRGGDASLISALEDPSILGVIAFEPVSLIQTPGQNYADPMGHGDRDYPTRPMLVFSASLDRDEPWPLVDTIYEQRTGPTSLVTIHGANHEWTYDADTPGNLTSQSQITEDERHAVDQAYSTAFMKRFAGADATHDAMLFGEQGLSTDLSSLGVSVAHDRYMSTEILVDDYQAGDATNLLGESNTSTDLDASQNSTPYDAGLVEWNIGGQALSRANDRGQARTITWSGTTGTFAASVGSLDLSQRRYLALRVHRDCPPPPGNTSLPDDTCPPSPTAFTLRIEDGSGGSHQITTGAAILGDLGIVGRHWSNVMMPLADANGVDLTDVSALVLEFDQLSAGTIWIDDLRLE